MSFAFVSSVHLPSSINSPRAVLVNTLVNDQMPCTLSILSPCQIIRPLRMMTSSRTPSLPTVLANNSTAACNFVELTCCDSGDVTSHSRPGQTVSAPGPAKQSQANSSPTKL